MQRPGKARRDRRAGSGWSRLHSTEKYMTEDKELPTKQTEPPEKGDQQVQQEPPKPAPSTAGRRPLFRSRDA